MVPRADFQATSDEAAAGRDKVARREERIKDLQQQLDASEEKQQRLGAECTRLRLALTSAEHEVHEATARLLAVEKTARQDTEEAAVLQDRLRLAAEELQRQLAVMKVWTIPKCVKVANFK